MSDIKADTWLSVLFGRIACAIYTVVLTKFKERLKDTEVGTEERFNEALDITKSMGFKDRTLCRFASLFTSISFFFMKDLDEQQVEAMLAEDEREKDDDEEAAS
jgi:hypothetical protein